MVWVCFRQHFSKFPEEILRTEKIHDFKYELFKLLQAMKFKSVPIDLFLNYFYLHGR